MSAYYQLVSREKAENITQATYDATPFVQGAWNPNEQHMAPVTGLLCAELENFERKENMRLGRLSFDILGMIPLGQCTIKTKCIRSGKTICLIESEFWAGDRLCVIARAWQMMTQDSTSIAGLENKAVYRNQDRPSVSIFDQWDGNFIKSITTVTTPEKIKAGKGIAWINTDIEMIEGQQTSDFVHIMGLVDCANGIVPRTQDKRWVFPNLDLQIHLIREPQGRWLGLETIQQFGEDGIGLTSSVLHDDFGVFGHAEQILTIRNIK